MFCTDPARRLEPPSRERCSSVWFKLWLPGLLGAVLLFPFRTLPRPTLAPVRVLAGIGLGAMVGAAALAWLAPWDDVNDAAAVSSIFLSIALLLLFGVTRFFNRASPLSPQRSSSGRR